MQHAQASNSLHRDPREPITPPNRANFIRLRTMILIRWAVIFGQVVAVGLAIRLYDLTFDLGMISLTIGVSIIGNLIALSLYPENKRLSENENFLTVLFDLLQLSFMLYLTGGLNNPFAVMLLGPVTISAGFLRPSSTLILIAVATILTSILAFFHFPLLTRTGEILALSEIMIFGKWIAMIVGIVFLSLYSARVATEMHMMADAVQAMQMALEREHVLTGLGGVVAAAAHELGTPLATIKLASGELAEELREKLPKEPALVEDAELIREQANRCRDILREMGQASSKDAMITQAPITAILREAAEPHQERGIQIHLEQSPGQNNLPSPLIDRKPELIHGLRNLIQNAVDFAAKEVRINILWDAHQIALQISDDGPGFPSHLLGRIGDPFIGRRRIDPYRPEYEGMGLGLFIAKTMLERTGAEINFSNGASEIQEGLNAPHGAIVSLVWARKSIEACSKTA